jgi:hypothetical protein
MNVGAQVSDDARKHAAWLAQRRPAKDLAYWRAAMAADRAQHTDRGLKYDPMATCPADVITARRNVGGSATGTEYDRRTKLLLGREPTMIVATAGIGVNNSAEASNVDYGGQNASAEAEYCDEYSGSAIDRLLQNKYIQSLNSETDGEKQVFNHATRHPSLVPTSLQAVGKSGSEHFGSTRPPSVGPSAIRALGRPIADPRINGNYCGPADTQRMPLAEERYYLNKQKGIKTESGSYDMTDPQSNVRLWRDSWSVLADDSRPETIKKLKERRTFRTFGTQLTGAEVALGSAQGDTMAEQLPWWRRGIQNRHYDRDAEENIGGFEFGASASSRGYDMTSLARRIERRPSANVRPSAGARPSIGNIEPYY